MKKLLQAKKLGSAIQLAVVALLILLALAMGSGLLSLGLDSRIFSTLTISDITAQCVADEGLTTTLFRMNVTAE